MPLLLPAMHCALAIPELLERVFRLLDTRCNFNNALVCWAWSEVALDALWRKVDGLYQLFSLLAPFGTTVRGEYELSRPLEYNDWLHFQRYSQRIREFSFDSDDGPDHVFRRSALIEIYRSRITLSILPNLHSLSWSAAIAPCVLFMHPNVKCFTVHIPRVEPMHIRPFFNDIAARMPTLTDLDIETPMPTESFENEAVQALSCLLQLKRLAMPRFSFTTRIAECISRLPELRYVDFVYNEEQTAIRDPESVAVFEPQFTEGAFASLSYLSLAATYKDVEYFLTSPFSPSNLALLYISSPDIKSTTAIQKLVTTVSKSCPMLGEFTFISAPQRPNDSDPTTTDMPQRVNMEMLKPLFGCVNLILLSVLHRLPLDLLQEDLNVLAPRWSSLTELTLNNELPDIYSSNLTLEALIPFARHCPNLTELGMFIDASPHVVPPFSSTSVSPSFKNLRRLNMGVSIIGEPAPVAMFLSRILPLGCKINGGVYYWSEPQEIQREARNIFKRRSVLWDKVDELLPLLTMARMEEREIIKEMK